MSNPLFLSQASCSDNDSIQTDGADTPGSLENFVENDDHATRPTKKRTFANISDAGSSDDAEAGIATKRRITKGVNGIELTPVHSDNLDDDGYTLPNAQLSIGRVPFETLITDSQELINNSQPAGQLPNAELPDEDVCGPEDLPKSDGKNFKIRRRYLFLTYPQCNIDKDKFLRLISECNYKFDRYIACREFHDDGTPHFHIVGDLGLNESKNAPQISNHKAFDIGGKNRGRADEPTWHPNIQPVISLDKSWHYINKLEKPGEEVFGNMSDPCLKNSAGMHKHNPYHSIIEAECTEEFMKAMKIHDPRALYANWSNVKSYAHDTFGHSDPQPEQWKPNFRNRQLPFTKIPIIEQWKKIFLDKIYKGRQVTLWIIGTQ